MPKQSALHPVHLQLNAKMTEFRGWQMPAQYSGISEEHYAVRTAVGLFDISFLGRIELAGPGASDLLQQTFTRNVSKIPEGTAGYGFICNEAGFILDDCVLFHLPKAPSGEDRYTLSTNAMNTGKILAWLNQRAKNVTILDRTGNTAHLALQGPDSDAVLEKVLEPHAKRLKPKAVKELPIAGAPVMVSRISYTGEHGYEFVVPGDRAQAVWELIMQAGQEMKILPCGLGARDLLRLEAGHVLYGNDIDESRTPLDAGFGKNLDLKRDFIGKDALVK